MNPLKKVYIYVCVCVYLYFSEWNEHEPNMYTWFREELISEFLLKESRALAFL